MKHLISCLDSYQKPHTHTQKTTKKTTKQKRYRSKDQFTINKYYLRKKVRLERINKKKKIKEKKMNVQ